MTSPLFQAPLNEEIRRLCQQIDEKGKEYWWISTEVASAFEAGGYHLLPRHFYTPIPDPETAAGTDFDRESYPLSNLAFDEIAAMNFLGLVARHAPELALQFPILGTADNDFFWENPFFTGLDAAALYTMIRTIRPQKIIEIGSGFSTHIALRALELNGKGKLASLEPYPTSKLLELSDRIEIIQSNVQSVPIKTFSSLASGDMLFIDSSHVSCMGSDVNFELFEILPNLPKGVIVHVHDIFLPYEYPREWVVDRRWYWNEQYMLYAFLRMNDSFEVWMPNHYMIRHHPEEVSSSLTFLGKRAQSGVSFWLRKIL